VSLGTDMLQSLGMLSECLSYLSSQNVKRHPERGGASDRVNALVGHLYNLVSMSSICGIDRYKIGISPVSVVKYGTW